MNYSFILGREPELSLAEIAQVLKANDQQFKIVSWSEQMAIFDLASVDFFDRLGGSIKVGEVEEVKSDKLFEVIEEKIRATIETGKRLKFGISVYTADKDISEEDLFDLQKEVTDFAFTLKKHLKIEQVSARFVTSQMSQLSSVVVKKNNLLESGGVEVLVGLGSEKVWVGSTMQVQDFEAFSSRDYGRPARDEISGMLPPKLARMMINLAGLPIENKTTLLDPFCGSGTVLQEAALLGAGKIIGSDNSAKAVKDSQTNMDWFLNNYLPGRKNEDSQREDDFVSPNLKVSIHQIDVRELTSSMAAASVDIIAAEPFLGEPVRKKLSGAEIMARNQELSELYQPAFVQLHKVIKDEGRAVVVIPFIGKKRVPLPKSFLKQWEIERPLEGVIEYQSVRGGLDYQRPNQLVGREILILRKVK